MAIKPSTSYPGNTNAPDAAYPYGSARDVSAPGAGDGTPLQADWVNDWYGFQQALLDDVNIEPSGNPEEVGASDMLDALDAREDRLLKPQWTLAEDFGTALSLAGAGTPALAALNGTDVAYFDAALLELRTYRLDRSAGTWSLVGSGLSIAGAGSPALAALNGTDVAFIDASNEELRTYRFNGTNWSLVGSGLSVTGLFTVALAALNGTDVAFMDSAIDELRTYRFNGSTWAQVGSGLSIAGAGILSLAALNGTDVAFIDGSNDELRTYRFNGSTWAQVGSGLSVTGAGTPALAALNGTDVAFIDGSNDELRTYRFDGSAWAQVGGSRTITGAAVPALAALNGTDVAFMDSAIDELRTYTLGFTTDRTLPNPYDLPLYGVRAWCNADCSVVAGVGDLADLRGAGNIASVTRTANTGEFDVLFEVPMPDANYSVTFGASQDAAAATTNLDAIVFYNVSTTGFTLKGYGATGTPDDLAIVCFQVVR